MLYCLVRTECGALVSMSTEAMVSNLPGDIAKRELAVVKERLSLPDGDLHIRSHPSPGPGNAIIIRVAFEDICEIFVGFGEIGVTAERVAERLCDTVRRFLKSEAAVNHHLADQLLLPMALGAGGEFTMHRPSLHFETNCAVIREFLDVDIVCSQESEGLWRTSLARSNR